MRCVIPLSFSVPGEQATKCALLIKTRRKFFLNLRLSLIVCCLLLAAGTVDALPCAQVKSQPDAWVAAKINALVTAARRAYEKEEAESAYEKVLDGITNTIRQCKLNDDDQLITRYREFFDYISILSIGRQPDHELGFIVPDKQYFEETRRYVQVPGFLLDQKFLRYVSRFETLNRARSFLRQLNATRGPSDQLIFFSYASRHLGTPDNDDSFRRLLIVVPANSATGEPEKWVQFGETDPGKRVRVRNVSVVATLPQAAGTTNVYFKDFFRTFRRNGAISLKGRWELGEGDDNCVQCHKSGILPICPVEGSVSTDEQEAVLAVNRRFMTYGPARFDKYLDTSKFGPGLSTANADDRRQRFGAEFGKTVVAHAMTCSACHQQQRLGAFSWPMDRVLISSFINGGRMPLGSS